MLKSDRAKVAFDVALLVSASIPVIFYRLGSYSIVNGDEAIYQGIAEAMVESGNWLRLDFRGTPRPYDTFMNAPLQYWARAALIEWFGSNLWTMRIGSALFGLASVLATYALAARFRDRWAGLLAAFVLLTTLHFVAIHGARTGELDTAVAFFVTAAVLMFIHVVERPAGRWVWLPHHLCLVALVSLKLPIVIIPVTAELICFAAIRRFRPHLAGWLVTGVAIAPFGLAWHLYQSIELGDTALDVFGSMLGHATGTAELDSPMGFLENARYYGKTLLFAAFPFVFAYPFALVSVLAGSVRGSDSDRWWVVATFLFTLCVFYLALSAHLRQYLIPAYPLLSVFVAVWIYDMARGPATLWQICAAVSICTLSIWIAIDFSGFNPFAIQANHIPMQPGWRDFAQLGPGVGLVSTAIVLAGALFAMQRLLGGHSGRTIGVIIGSVLLSTASLRVVLPLRYVGHQSEMALLRQRIDRDRAAARPIPLPIEIREMGLWRARYYFALEYQVQMRVRAGSGREGVQFLLDQKEPRSGQ